jgi:tRNA-2-methylthio-N6-dimethylallyladenosine synthase
MARKVYIKTFGCQMNEYDSDKMADVLNDSDGVESVQHMEDADIVLYNTCSVREKAQEKVFSDLGRARALKEKNPELIIGVGGCVASQEGDAIVNRAPFVDLVFGPQTLHRLPRMIREVKRSGESQVDISFPEIEKFDHLPPARIEGCKAFVSIMEGCSKYCSFCVVPYTRGEEVSRPMDDVLTDIAEVAEQGVKEVTLLGQNVNAWVGPFERDAEQTEADFATLLDYASEIPGIERIRYTTSHPREFSNRLIQAHASLPKLPGHVHLPVQAGSDRVLSAMKRGYTTLEFKSIIRRLRAACPEICISSDFIVGFPGETDEDFEQTMDLVRWVGFDTSFSFIYSPRPGTPAANLPDETPHETKLKRLQTLQAEISANAAKISEAMVGTVQPVLVDGFSRKSDAQVMGRTDNNRIVNFDGTQTLIGSMVNVRITEALPHSLRGVVCD